MDSDADGRYGEARDILDRVVHTSPYNTIAKKNLARISQLETVPAASKQGRKTGGAPQLFIEESGKSTTTLLHRLASAAVVASNAPGDPVRLVIEKNAINVYVHEDEYLGQIEPKLVRR